MLDRLPDSQERPTTPTDPHLGSGTIAQPNATRTPPPSGDPNTPWPEGADLGRVRAVIEALPEAVFVTESDGQLRLTNPAADRLFAGQPVHDRADLLSRFEAVSPDRGPGRAAAQLADELRHPVTVRRRGQPNRWFALRTVDLESPSDEPATMGDGPTTSVSPAPSPAGAHEPPGPTVFVLRDVTDSRDLQPVREAFLAILSHELRTPITTIYAGSSVLARQETLSAPATRTLARDISAEAARLYDLVEDLLVLARVERSVLNPHDEPLLLQRSVDATIRMLGDRLPDSPIDRTGDVDAPPVHGDATYVEQACRNLILAGIRYAGPDPGRRLLVDVRWQPDAGEVTVAVLDRSPGLSDEELEHAFELPNPSTVGRLAAAGVGPFVCRHLVEAMGGRVWAGNRPDDGGLEMGFALRVDERV